MRKNSIIFLILIILVLFTGCNLKYDKSLALDEPPKLFVKYEDNTVEALKCGYNWTTFDRFGNAKSTITDSAHPLQSKEYTPIITRNNDDFITLEFEVEPKSYTVQAWSDIYWDNDNFDVDTSQSVNVNNNIINLLDDESGVIYVINATWELDGYYEGTRTYSIYIKNK